MSKSFLSIMKRQSSSGSIKEDASRVIRQIQRKHAEMAKTETDMRINLGDAKENKETNPAFAEACTNLADTKRAELEGQVKELQGLLDRLPTSKGKPIVELPSHLQDIGKELKDLSGEMTEMRLDSEIRLLQGDCAALNERLSEMKDPERSKDSDFTAQDAQEWISDIKDSIDDMRSRYSSDDVKIQSSLNDKLDAIGKDVDGIEIPEQSHESSMKPT